MQITAVVGTDLFARSAHGPRQVVRVHLEGPGAVTVRIEGPTVSTPEPVRADLGPTGAVVEVPVVIAAPAPEGSVHRVTAVARATDGAGTTSTLESSVTAAATGWTMWMVSHFHYDPVWWNTQAGFTQTWYDLPVAEGRRPPICRTAFDLVRAHLDAALDDPDYTFVLAEVDYLKPFWDAFPRDRADLRRLLAAGRVEIVGGTYNEPNTNLTHPESTVRNAVAGMRFQRDVLGADPRTAWQLDVFGHDPAFPGLMAQAGLDSSAWARGPHHMVGAKRHTGDITRSQLSSEFEWLSPSGRGVLTHVMADHYVAGWQVEVQPDLESALRDAHREFGELKQVAATRNVLLPVGHDHNVPSRWVTQIHREWAARYEWPRFRTGLPRDFFEAVRAEAADRPGAIIPQTRDMNPVFTGKDVSYIDTKQAQRAGEVAVLDAERLATVAWLAGATYPAAALDKAWRQLLYGAHHDAITGTESDQVYLDLLAGWREAHDLGVEVREAALDHLATVVDTTGPGRPVLVANTLSWNRSGPVTVRLELDPGSGPEGLALVTTDGAPVPAVTVGVERRPDGRVSAVTLTALVPSVPALGVTVLHAVPAPSLPAGWTPVDPVPDALPAAQNDRFRVEADPARGGALTRWLDRRAGRDLLRPGSLGAEAYLQDEHPQHPVWGEGPWHLLPRGPGRGAGERIGQVRVETSPIGERLVSTVDLDGLRLTQEVTLPAGADHVDLALHVDGSIGQDRLLRTRFGFDLPGALPVAEVGFAVVGRSPGFPDVDAADHLWTLDSPAHTWAGLSATVRIALRRPDGGAALHAIGVAEVVAPAPGTPGAPTADAVRALVSRLASLGVTATVSRPDGPRYGALDADSNLPDVRIVIGADSAPAREVLAAADPQVRAGFETSGRGFVPGRSPRAQSVRPDADLRGATDLPVLLVAAAAIDALVADLDDATIEVDLPAAAAGTTEPFCGASVAVVNAGTPGFVVDTDGTLHVALMRACSGWPCGVWIDGEPRTTPDGASFAWQHWSHTFRLGLLAGAGDWRDAGFVTGAAQLTHPLLARPVAATAGPLPAGFSAGRVDPPTAVLSALRPLGTDAAAGRFDPPAPGQVAVRLYEAHGAPTPARLTLHGGHGSARAVNLLEDAPDDAAGRDAVSAHDGGWDLPLAPAEVVTLAAAVDPAGWPVPAGGAGAALGPVHEPVQPVHARYWLCNLGPAPIGGLPLAVHATPSRLHLPAGTGGTAAVGGPGEPLLTTVTVTAAAGTRCRLEVLAPPGVAVELHPGPEVVTGPAGFAEVTARLRVAGVAPGRAHLLVRVRHDGQVVEDSVELEIGDLAPADLLVVDVGPDRLRVPAGGRGSLEVRLTGTAAGPVHGELLALVPFGGWGGPGGLSVGPRTQPFAVGPGECTRLALDVVAAGTARPGTRLWAGVKVAVLDRAMYSRTVHVEVS